MSGRLGFRDLRHSVWSDGRPRMKNPAPTLAVQRPSEENQRKPAMLDRVAGLPPPCRGWDPRPWLRAAIEDRKTV